MDNHPISQPPVTQRQAVVDVIHGYSVPDPYRWLEDGNADETRTWVAQQNERTRQALDARPDRGQWHERLVALMALPAVGGVEVRGERLFVFERAAGAEQFALVLRSATDPLASPITLIDPASFAFDSAAAIDWFEPSPDGSLIAYGVSEGGTEDSTLSVLHVATGAKLLDSIPNTRAASVAWLGDSSGFYYTKYPAGDQYNRRVALHHLGTDANTDEVIWSDPNAPQSWPGVQLSPDDQHLLVTVMVGWGQTELFLLHIATGLWSTVISGVEATTGARFLGDQLLLNTTYQAPKGRVARVDLANPQLQRWATVIPEHDGVLGSMTVCGQEIIVVVTERAVDHLERWSLDGSSIGPQPDLGVVSIAGLVSEPTADVAFAVVAGFDRGSTLVRVRGSEVSNWLGAAIASLDLVVEQVVYPSLDGTEVGMFIVRSRSTVPGPGVPTILNGYGGFAIAETPVWSPLIAAWCEQGGVYAIAGLRGGFEEGEAWHNAGRRALKQNVFDDFHAAADWLVGEGRSDRDHLAIAGGSNGGLLVGVALTQRPDLCRAVWCAVPLLDMIRYPEFLIARLWTDEYGDPAVAEEFEWLWAYSPYHHVVEGTHYPAVLLSTAEGDTRVDPLHARKMAAQLQAAAVNEAQRPVLLFQDGRSGHGVGKPASKKADESADVLAFFSWQLGVTR